ncbi:MAG: M28 family peptidase [Acidobacteriota bacterium]
MGLHRHPLTQAAKPAVLALMLGLAPGIPTGAALESPPPLLEKPVLAALASELSGETAMRNLEVLAGLHRMRGSAPFHAAAEAMVERLKAYGLADARILQFPADGKIFYGTQRSRPAWDAQFAELWELRREGLLWASRIRLASWDAMPVTLAEDSESADVSADLVDVGEGTSDKDYRGKEVEGKIVLAAAQPGPVARLAVLKYGAVGIVSYAQNQKTAWFKENKNLIRWGHLETFGEARTFAFMVSLKEARRLQDRLAAGKKVRLHAVVRAGRHAGFYDVATAALPGADETLKDQEIAFSCHLDHQRPGANDNASGCVTILEIARTLARLIRGKRIPPPARTLRFIWPPEVEGTLALLNARPDLARRIRAVIHLDMVGGGPVTGAVFHVTRGPASLPSFINDVAEAFGRFVNEQTRAFASGRDVSFPLVAPEGGKEALQAVMSPFSMGSDHQVYSDGSFGIPAIYLNDWPDRFIHTDLDRPANIDPTKLKRAAFIAAASGLFLASYSEEDAAAVWSVLRSHALERLALMLQRRASLSASEAAVLTRFHLAWEDALLESMTRLAPLPAPLRREAEDFMKLLGEAAFGPGSVAAAAPPAATSSGAGTVYRRKPSPRGPLSVFGYDYLEDHLGQQKSEALSLFSHQGLRGGGGDYAYEALNLVDGVRNLPMIRDALSAIYGPVPLEKVDQYLKALETIGILERTPPK